MAPPSRKTSQAFSALESPSTASYEPCFRYLFYAGFVLLWGVGVVNGLARDLLVSPLSGGLPGGFPIKTYHSGIYPLDYLMSALIAMFWTGTNAQDDGYQLFMLDLYVLLHLGYLVLYVESLRPGQKPNWIGHPLISTLIWQCFGGGVAMPLYFTFYATYASKSRITRVANVHGARGMAPAFILAAVGSVLMLMGPTWFGPDSRTRIEHQNIIAWFQPTVVYVPLILNGVWYVSSFVSGSSQGSGRSQAAQRRSEAREAHLWIRGLYLTATVIAIIGRWYILARVFTAADTDKVNFVRMYVPFTFSGPSDVAPVLMREPWLFLQWDNIVITISDAVWVIMHLRTQTPLGKEYSATTMGLLVVLGYVLIGPAATYALALYIREGYLPDSVEEDLSYKN